MQTENQQSQASFSQVVRVSHLYGVRFASIVGLILGFLSLVGLGLLFVLDAFWVHLPLGGQGTVLLIALIIWLLVTSALVQWAYEKLWRRPVTIRDLGSQVAISVGDREDRHPWSDLRKVRLHQYRVGQTGQMRTKSLNLVLTFEGRIYRLGTDEHQRQLRGLEAYCQRQLQRQAGDATY